MSLLRMDHTRGYLVHLSSIGWMVWVITSILLKHSSDVTVPWDWGNPRPKSANALRSTPWDCRFMSDIERYWENLVQYLIRSSSPHCPLSQVSFQLSKTIPLRNPDFMPQQESEGAPKPNLASSWRPIIRPRWILSRHLLILSRHLKTSQDNLPVCLWSPRFSKLRLFDIAGIGFSPHVSSRVDWLTLASNRGNVKHSWLQVFSNSSYKSSQWPSVAPDLI